MELRFHIPSSELAGDDPVENFKDQVLGKASIISATGDAIAIFREIQCLTPRYGVFIFLFCAYCWTGEVYIEVIYGMIYSEVVMISRFSKHSFNFMVKRLTTKFLCPPFCVFSYFLTRMDVRCFS